jgi:oligosaccharide repeat unit polymerase
MIVILKLTIDWFSPARISALMWVFLIIGYHIFATDALYYYGVLWLVLSMIVLAIGEAFGSKILMMPNKFRTTSTQKPLGKISWNLLTIFIALGMLGDLIYLYKNGFNFSSFLSLASFLDMNATIAYNRYSSSIDSSIWITLLFSFSYTATLCGGYLYLYSETRFRKILCYISFLPMVFNVAFTNTKSGIIACIFLFAIGYMVSYLTIYHKAIPLKHKYIIAGIVILFSIFILLGIVMCIRIGDFSKDTIEIVKRKFITYAFGSVQAFDIWYSEYFYQPDFSLGAKTFMGPFALLGLYEREQGVYGNVGNIPSNVFTAYRGIILDYGSFGGIVFVFLAGILGGASHANIKRGSKSMSLKLIYSSTLFFLLHSMFGSPWVYTSFWLVFVVFFLFIAISENKIRVY